MQVNSKCSYKYLYRREAEGVWDRRTWGSGTRPRDWDDAATSQGMPGPAWCGSAGVLTSDFWPLELWGDEFLLLEATHFMVLSYVSAKELTHMATLDRMVRKNLRREKACAEWPKGSSLWIPGGETFQAEGTASGKALTQGSSRENG